MDIKDILLEKRKKGPKKVEVTERIPVFDQNQDINSVISSIVYEMKDDNNKLAQKYNLPWTQLKFCNVKFAGDKIVMDVEERKGGFRIRGENPKVLQAQMNDVIKLMDKFEKSLKAEFKERTGKALSMKNTQTKADCMHIAMNGLHRFNCIRTANISAKLEGQTFEH